MYSMTMIFRLWSMTVLHWDKTVCWIDCKFTFRARRLFWYFEGQDNLPWIGSNAKIWIYCPRHVYVPSTVSTGDLRCRSFLHCEREDDTAVVFVIRRKRTWFRSRRLAYASCICGVEWVDAAWMRNAERGVLLLVYRSALFCSFTSLPLLSVGLLECVSSRRPVSLSLGSRWRQR